MENCTQKTPALSKSKTKPLIIASDFNGNIINFNQDGWFNATQVAATFDKRIDHWLENKETQEYISILNTRNYGDLIITKRGKYGGGTWMHPKLAIFFARWLSADFAIWCDEQIEGIIFGGRAAQQLKESELIKMLVSEKRDAHKEMMDALVEQRHHLGKGTESRHFIIENKLCNWAVTKSFSGIDESQMNPEELQLLMFARKTNESLILAGFEYDERKHHLAYAVEHKRRKLNKLMAA